MLEFEQKKQANTTLKMIFKKFQPKATFRCLCILNLIVVFWQTYKTQFLLQFKNCQIKLHTTLNNQNHLICTKEFCKT